MITYLRLQSIQVENKNLTYLKSSKIQQPNYSYLTVDLMLQEHKKKIVKGV